MKFLKTSIKLLLFLTAFTPLIITWSTIFPFILGKTLFFRSVVEIALVLFLIYFLLNLKTLKPLNFETLKQSRQSNGLTGQSSKLLNFEISKHPALFEKRAGATGQVFKLLNFETFKQKFKNPLVVFILLFFISLIVSVIFAVNPYRAFWGDLERGEGLWTMLHAFAFLIMALVIFDSARSSQETKSNLGSLNRNGKLDASNGVEKKDWLRFFKISLVVGFVIIFYAILQYFNVSKFPFALAPQERPISYIGNPAFLATHMFFLIMFATIIYGSSASIETAKRTFKLLNFETLKPLFWRYFSLLIILLSIATIFLTATRGAILGLAVGILFLLVYFAVKNPVNLQTPKESRFRQDPMGRDFKLLNFKTLEHLNIRRISIALLFLIIIFSGFFWLTREAAIWQKIPGLNRLAQTKILDVNDPSTQFRLITWKLSWNAFKEKPLFGWGPENYISAYEKYYDPEYAVYGETWLDRAHNKIVDVAVMQGIFGLLAYLGIFGALFYLLFKSKEPSAPFLAAGLSGYFVQNLFVFDQVISDFTFFAILGFILSLKTFKPLNFETLKLLNFKTFKFLNIIISTLILGFILVVIYSLYFYNLIPYIQARLFKASPGISKNVNVVVDYLKKSMYPYNFAQFNIRGSGIDTIYMDQFFYRTGYVDNPHFRPLGDLLIAGMDELVKREPYDIRVLIREVEMLNGYTRVMDEKEAAPLFEKAERLMREAIKRAPNRQEVYYHLAFNLAGQKRYDEAIETAKYAISLNPKVARAHFHLALVSTIANKNKEALEALAEVDKLDPDLKTLMSGDKDATLLIYTANNRLDKAAEIITASLNRGENRAFDRKYYEAALRYYALKTDAQHFVQVAKYLKQFDDLKDDMEVLIDLAEKGLWEIINKL